MTQRPIFQIANEIANDWKSINYAAQPYLEAMLEIASIDQNYGYDTARGIVTRFLGNASSYRGDKAKQLKAELKDLLLN
jgi:hypothetical protein